MKTSHSNLMVTLLVGGSLISAPVVYAADTPASNATAAAAPASPASNVTVAAAPAVVTGPTQYVTDQFQITLRSGPGLGNQILRMLSTGDPVTVIQQNAQNGYSEVRTPDGVQGWVLTRFLMGQPTARQQLAKEQELVKQTNAQLNTAQQTLAQTNNALEAKTKAEANLQTRFDDLQKRYQTLRDTAKNAVAIADENTSLKQRVSTLSKQLSSVTSENDTLRNTGLIRWFMAGGGVLLAGLILGLLMPYIARRRRDNWFT